MADEDLIAVLLLLGVRPVDVVPEGGLDPRSIFIILLGAEEGIVRMAVWAPLPPGAQGQSGGCSPQEAAPGGVFLPQPPASSETRGGQARWGRLPSAGLC